MTCNKIESSLLLEIIKDDFTTKLKPEKTADNNYSDSFWMQPLKASEHV